MTYLGSFINRHHIGGKADFSIIKKTLDYISEANDIFKDVIINLPQIESDIVQLTHLNLIGRIFEQVEGMLVCIVTNSPTSAEALARAVVEGSINLIYLAKRGDEHTIHDFFKAWTTEHLKKLERWKREVDANDTKLLYQINERVVFVTQLDDWVNKFKAELKSKGLNSSVPWPSSLFDRFKHIDEVQSYYSYYHRLSGSIHFTSEDTILWLLAVLYDRNNESKSSEVARAYSIMMARFTCLFFINAIHACCERHGLKDLNKLDRLAVLKKKIQDSAIEMGEAAGVPIQGS